MAQKTRKSTRVKTAKTTKATRTARGAKVKALPKKQKTGKLNRERARRSAWSMVMVGVVIFAVYALFMIMNLLVSNNSLDELLSSNGVLYSVLGIVALISLLAFSEIALWVYHSKTLLAIKTRYMALAMTFTVIALVLLSVSGGALTLMGFAVLSLAIAIYMMIQHDRVDD